MINIDKSLKKLLNKSSSHTLSVKRKYYPQKLSPMGRRPSGSASPILKRFNLKKFGGRNDLDGDGVPNWKDCQPRNVMRQDFTPFPSYKSEKAAEMTAARRFGGRNLKRLKKLGQGRDRVVYALDKDKVLKVAKNPGGLTQNMSESDLDYLGQLKHYETGKDYAVMQRAEKPGVATRKFLKPLKKAASESGPRMMQLGMRPRMDLVYQDFMGRPEVQKADEETEGFFGDLASFGPVNPRELIAKRQWGEIEGKPVLVDAGVLVPSESLSKYRVKDFQNDKRNIWQLEEWREVQRQRQQFRRKGKPDEDREIYWAKRNRLPEDYVMREAGDFFDVVDSKEELNKQKNKKKDYTTEDYFSFSDLRSSPVIERKTYGSITAPQINTIQAYEKPVRKIGHFRDMFKHGDEIKVVNPRRDMVVGTVRKEGDKVRLMSEGSEDLIVDPDDELYYEEWYGDKGSILFNNPKNPEGRFLKLATEGDTIRVNEEKNNNLADYNVDTDVVDSDEEVEETPRLVDGGDVVEDLSEEVDKRINDDPVVQMDYQYENDYDTEVDNNYDEYEEDNEEEEDVRQE